MVGKGKGEEVAVRAGRVFTDAAALLLGSADTYTHMFPHATPPRPTTLLNETASVLPTRKGTTWKSRTLVIDEQK